MAAFSKLSTRRFCSPFGKERKNLSAIRVSSCAVFSNVRFSFLATASLIIVQMPSIYRINGALSETVGGAGEFCGMGFVFAGFFAAEAWRWKNLRGIRKLQRVEGGADALHGG